MNTMLKSSYFDIIIVGGSYAGLSAAMALGRALRSVLVIDAGAPCNRQTPYSHNFLTNDGKPPGEIARLAKDQVQQYNNVHFVQGFATTATKTPAGFELQLQTGESFRSRKLIIASGIKDLMPAIPGFAESWGISVLHCPYCHGYEVRHQTTGILANGNAGFETAALISNWTRDLTLYTNGKSFLSEQQKTKLIKHQIPVVEDEIDHLVTFNGHVQSIVFRNGTNAPINAIYARLPFAQHSSIPLDLGCELTEEGYIKTDPAHRTTFPGVYACGDNTSQMRTVANAVAMGTTTGLMINRELIEEDF